MKELIGSPGMVSGMLMRIGQFLFAAASIGVMVSAPGFYNYTAFWYIFSTCAGIFTGFYSLCYLIASMGLQLLWSFGLGCLDVYALRIKRDLQNPVLVSLFVVGDWVTATLSLAASCSSAGVAVLYARDLDFCKVHSHIPCGRYELSIALAFVTWFLTAISSHVMFWILAMV